MNPIALRLSAMSLELEGCGMPEIVEAFQIAEREILRLEERPRVTEEMVTRFLGWKLPQDFNPDGGVTFKPINHPACWPVGTNLLTAVQARAMLEHVLAQPQEGSHDKA